MVGWWWVVVGGDDVLIGWFCLLFLLLLFSFPRLHLAGFDFPGDGEIVG